MKRHILYFITSLFLFLIVAISCTKKENPFEETKPGTYTIEKMVQAIKEESKSRGINNSNTDFDAIYDPNYVYLHIVGSEESVYMPLYTVQCADNTQCKCFRYHIDILDNGDAIVTPILEDGSLSNEKLTIKQGSSCYFSSVEESVWELEDDQIYQKENHTLYRPKDDINKEVYRSIENFSIAQLTNNIDDLIMGRACAAFTVLGLFYDGDELNTNPDPEEEDVEITPEEFLTIMGSEFSKWYMKIYIGGKPFVNKYNYGTMAQETSDQNDTNYGYYSTGTFQDELNNHEFKPFKRKKYGLGQYTLRCYGYYTDSNSRLLTPALNTTTALDVYILIKNWDKEGTPTPEWLADDSDALYTRMNITGDIYPYNNCFYTLGLLMDIRQFKKAWDAAQSSRASRTANGMHYFELENAKVIFEKY